MDLLHIERYTAAPYIECGVLLHKEIEKGTCITLAFEEGCSYGVWIEGW